MTFIKATHDWRFQHNLGEIYIKITFHEAHNPRIGYSHATYLLQSPSHNFEHVILSGLRRRHTKRKEA